MELVSKYVEQQMEVVKYVEQKMEEVKLKHREIPIVVLY